MTDKELKRRLFSRKSLESLKTVLAELDSRKPAKKSKSR
jgi:hypothetical protein